MMAAAGGQKSIDRRRLVAPSPSAGPVWYFWIPVLLMQRPLDHEERIRAIKTAIACVRPRQVRVASLLQY